MFAWLKILNKSHHGVRGAMGPTQVPKCTCLICSGLAYFRGVLTFRTRDFACCFIPLPSALSLCQQIFVNLATKAVRAIRTAPETF